MNTRIVVISFLLSLSILSCKKEDKKEIQPEQVKEASTKDLFKVTIDLLIKKNDTIHLYYTEDGSINFNEENSIWLPVEGKDINQEVTFLLPKDIFPTEFRLDFGVNQNQDEVFLNKVKFDYLDKSFVANDSLIYNYFRIDENETIMNPKTKGLSRKNPKQKKGASIYPHEVSLKAEIDKLVK